MTDEKTPQAAGSTEAEQVFRIQRIYLKDVSFESPQSPALFIGNVNWQPNVQLHLNTESAKFDNDLYESVLTVTADVKLNDKTAYLAEVKQSGLFFRLQESSGCLAEISSFS